MIINTESTVVYNNKLKQAVAGMKLGVNNGVNPGTKKSGLKTMEGDPSKINPQTAVLPTRFMLRPRRSNTRQHRLLTRRVGQGRNHRLNQLLLPHQRPWKKTKRRNTKSTKQRSL